MYQGNSQCRYQKMYQDMESFDGNLRNLSRRALEMISDRHPDWEAWAKAQKLSNEAMSITSSLAGIVLHVGSDANLQFVYSSVDKSFEECCAMQREIEESLKSSGLLLPQDLP